MKTAKELFKSYQMIEDDCGDEFGEPIPEEARRLPYMMDEDFYEAIAEHDKEIISFINGVIDNEIKDAYMGQQALQNGGLTEEQENFEFVVNDAIIKTLSKVYKRQRELYAEV